MSNTEAWEKLVNELVGVLDDTRRGFITRSSPPLPRLKAAMDAYVDSRVGEIMANSDWTGAQLIRIGEVKS